MRMLLVLLAFTMCLLADGQDTLRIGIAQADSLLIQRSLALLAQRYQVDMAEAERVQARLFQNPTLATEWSIRPSTGRVLDVAQPNGQMAVTAEKLFRIAGQRSLAVRAATSRVRLAEAEYAELAAALRFALHSNLYRQFYLSCAIAAIGSQLDLLKGVVDAYGTQFEKGNVSLKEATRLRTAYFQLDDERARLLMEVNGIQQELRTLLMEERVVVASPLAAEVVPLRPLPQDSVSLMALAEANRPRLRAAEAGVQASEEQLRLERRMAYPDLALGYTYDRNSNYLPNYNGLNIGIAVPLFDRNQAGIRRAQAEQKQARSQAELARQSVRQEVMRSLADLRVLQQHYTSASRGLDEQLDQLSESLVANYLKSNISLLEFTDLFEAYTSGIIAINSLKADLQQAYEELEFVSGQRLFVR
ncbi:MAG: TolC family protein [Flavobacteriales bacterium]|nr:TolC family protein [Flavobacteriales bacterium]